MLENITLENGLIHIRPNSARRLKMRGSERILPWVGYAKLVMDKTVKQGDIEYLFPRHIKNEFCKVIHASAALGKWLEKDFDGLITRKDANTFRDTLAGRMSANLVARYKKG